MVEGASVAEFVEEVEVVDGFEDLYEANDVGGFDFVKDVNLVEGALLEFWVILESFNIDDFDCNFFVCSGVDSSIDFAVLSLSDLFVKGVVFDDLDHPLVLYYLKY